VKKLRLPKPLSSYVCLKASDSYSVGQYHKYKYRKMPYSNHRVIDHKNKKQVLQGRFHRTGNHFYHVRFTQVRNSEPSLLSLYSLAFTLDLKDEDRKQNPSHILFGKFLNCAACNHDVTPQQYRNYLT